MPYSSTKPVLLQALPIVVAAIWGLIEFFALARSRWRSRSDQR